MLTINLDTSTPEENQNWVEFGNSLTGIKYADISVANGGIILYLFLHGPALTAAGS